MSESNLALDFEDDSTQGIEALTHPDRPDWLNDTTVVQAPEGWWLCSMSEEYLKQSFEGGTITIVNDALVVKPVGKLAALCVKDVLDPNGKVLFQKGNWYCPVGDCRKELEANFGLGDYNETAGQTRINLMRSSWTLMRPAHPKNGQSVDEYLKDVIDQTSKLPTKFTPRNVFREQMPVVGGGHQTNLNTREYYVFTPRTEEHTPITLTEQERLQARRELESLIQRNAIGHFRQNEDISLDFIRQRLMNPQLENNLINPQLKIYPKTVEENISDKGNFKTIKNEIPNYFKDIRSNLEKYNKEINPKADKRFNNEIISWDIGYKKNIPKSNTRRNREDF